MTFMDEFRLSRDAMLGESGFSSDAARGGLEDSKPTPIQFGYYLDRKTGRTGIPLLCDTALHLVLFGLNGAGKQTRFLNRLYMTARGRSLFIVETKGTAALQTAHERRKFSETKVICPIPVLGLESDGFNPLRHLDRKSPHFLGDCRALARAMIDLETGTGKHWSESATGLVTAIIMWEVILAEREGRVPSLLNVRMMLTEPERWEEYIEEDEQRKLVRKRKRLVAGLQLTAARMIEDGDAAIISLIGRFVRPDGKDELAGILSTADTQTQFLLNEYIAADLSKGDDVDLTQLSQRLMSVYVVCAAGDLPEYRRWIRMVLSFALRAQLSRPPRHTCLYSLDEYRATIGQLDLVKDDWALVREHGVQFLVCTQSALHLKTLHGDEWQDFVGQAGAFATIGPPGDEFTAEFMSKRCGMRTVLKKGVNIGESVNGGDTMNDGDSVSPGGASRNKSRGASKGLGLSATFTVQQVEQRAVMVQALFNMKPGEGRLWLQNDGVISYPFFAPNYWLVDEPWAKRIGENPYYNRMRGIEDAGAARGAPDLRVIEGGKSGTVSSDTHGSAASDTVSSAEREVHSEAVSRLGRLGEALGAADRVVARREVSDAIKGREKPDQVKPEASVEPAKDDGGAPGKAKLGEAPNRVDVLQARVNMLAAESAQAKAAAAMLPPVIAVLMLPGVKRLLLARFDPDKHPNATDIERQLLGDAFAKITAAYQIAERRR
jgi:hypothetical protein